MLNKLVDILLGLITLFMEYHQLDLDFLLFISPISNSMILVFWLTLFWRGTDSKTLYSKKTKATVGMLFITELVAKLALILYLGISILRDKKQVTYDPKLTVFAIYVTIFFNSIGVYPKYVRYGKRLHKEENRKQQPESKVIECNQEIQLEIYNKLKDEFQSQRHEINMRELQYQHRRYKEQLNYRIDRADEKEEEKKEEKKSQWVLRGSKELSDSENPNSSRPSETETSQDEIEVNYVDAIQ